MSSALALSGNDTFVARVVTESKTPGLLRKSDSRVSLSGKGGKRPWRHRIIAALSITLLFIGIGGAFLIQGQKQAQANWLTDGIRDIFCGTPAYFNDPVGWQNGLTSLGVGMLGGNPVAQSGAKETSIFQGGDKNFLDEERTAYDKMGMGGATWTIYSGEKDPGNNDRGTDRVTTGEADSDLRVAAYDNECIPVVGIVTTYMANSIFSFTKFLTSVSGWIITQAYEPDWIRDLNDMAHLIITGETVERNTNGDITGYTDTGVEGLKETLYLEFLNLVIFFGALWLFYTGIVKRRTTEATTGAMWMVGAVIAGSLLVYNPSLLPNITNSITSEISGALLVGTSKTTAESASAQGDTVNICAGNTNTDDRDFIINGTNCQFWRAFVYEPWVVGQFGVSSSNELLASAPEVVNLGGGNEVNNLALYQMDQQVISPDELGLIDDDESRISVYSTNQDNWYKVVDKVASPDAGERTSMFSSWAGSSGGGDRLAIATASIVASLFGIIVTTVLAMGMLVYSIAASILMFFSVIFLLLGAHPGMGRRMAMKWFELYVGAVLKKLLLAAMLSMMLAFYTAILSNSTQNWAGSVVAVIALSVAILMYRKELVDTIGNSINFGGAGFGDQQANKAAQMAKGLAGGAAIGLGVGALSGAKAGAGIMSSGAGTARARMSEAAKATAKGAGKGAVKTAVHAGTHAGGYMNNPMLTGIGIAQGVGADQQAGATPQQRFEAREQAKVDKKNEATQRQQYAQWAAENPENAKYREAWEKNHRNEEWAKRTKERYGLKRIPNPYQESFSGFGKLPSEWKEGDAPRPWVLPDDEMGENAPQPQSSETGNNESQATVDTEFVPADNSPETTPEPSPAPAPQRRAIPTPPPGGRRTVYNNEYERREEEARDAELAKRRERQLSGGANAMPQRPTQQAPSPVTRPSQGNSPRSNGLPTPKPGDKSSSDKGKKPGSGGGGIPRPNGS